MAQEFTIKSADIESKINQLLPSQGGFQPGVDFSASTMVVPIVDLTETAEGSSLRQDLQTSLSLTSANAFAVSGTSPTTIINTTGYYRIFGNCTLFISAGTATAQFQISDGLTTKIITKFELRGSNLSQNTNFDFNVFLEAGDELQGASTAVDCILNGNARQIADISGNLINP